MDILTSNLHLLLLFAVVVGHRWLAGMAHGAADAGDGAGAVKMILLSLVLQGSGYCVAFQFTEAQPDAWGFTFFGLCAVATAVPMVQVRDEIRLFALLLGHCALYAIVARMVPVFTTGVVLTCALVPSVLATATGWNKGAGYGPLGEHGAPVPRLNEVLLYGSALSVAALIGFVTYRMII